VRRACGRRRGIALADFVAGTVILAGVVSAFTSMTRAKFDALAEAELHGRAAIAVQAGLDEVRARGLSAEPSGPADIDGFRRVEALAVRDEQLAEASAEVQARFLRMASGEAHGLYEVRVVVRWRGRHGEQRLSGSTVAPLPRRGR